jgi:hypothetical protein
MTDTNEQQINNTSEKIKHLRVQKFYLSKRRLVLYALSVPSLLFIGYLLGLNFPPEQLSEFVLTVFAQIDRDIWLYILAGFTAQMIDGALGMAYGVTATSFLLSIGISPAASSASVHASEIVTSGVSGLMHLKMKNVNSKLFKALLIPGMLGAVIGAYLLSFLEDYNHYIKPIVSCYTLFLGVVIIMKALKKDKIRQKIRRLFPLAFAGGLLDSIGGGGWGPIVSSTLIANGRNPQYTIGSANLAEFFVALASSVAFITVIGLTHWTIILGLILGGVVAAPIAAFLANRIPTQAIMILVGVVVILVSLKRIFF